MLVGILIVVDVLRECAVGWILVIQLRTIALCPKVSLGSVLRHRECRALPTYGVFHSLSLRKFRRVELLSRSLGPRLNVLHWWICRPQIRSLGAHIIILGKLCGESGGLVGLKGGAVVLHQRCLLPLDWHWATVRQLVICQDLLLSMTDHAIRGLLRAELQETLFVSLLRTCKCMIEGHYVVNWVCSRIFFLHQSFVGSGDVGFKERLRCISWRYLLRMSVVCSIATTNWLKWIFHAAHLYDTRIELSEALWKILILVGRCLGGAHFQNPGCHSVLICSFVYLLSELRVLRDGFESSLPVRYISIVNILCDWILAQILCDYIRWNGAILVFERRPMRDVYKVTVFPLDRGFHKWPHLVLQDSGLGFKNWLVHAQT